MPAVSAEALAALDPPEAAPRRRLGVRDRRRPHSGGLRDQAGAGRGSGGERRGDREAARPALRLPARHIVVAPLDAPAFAMPAAAWAARSGDPVLFAGRKKLPKATAAASAQPSEGRRPTCSARSSAISSDVAAGSRRDLPAGAPRRRRGPGRQRDRPRPLRDGGFGWNVNDPGHGFVVARSDEPLDAAAAAPLSAAGTWGPLLLTDDAGTLPAALRGYLLDVKPGYTEDPTRAFYNHVWVIGDQEAIEVDSRPKSTPSPSWRRSEASDERGREPPAARGGQPS